MNYSIVENLIWCGEDKSAFNCDVTFEGLGVVPFTCAAGDFVEHAQNIWTRAMAGEFGPIAEPLPLPPSGEIPQEQAIPSTDTGAIL